MAVFIMIWWSAPWKYYGQQDIKTCQFKKTETVFYLDPLKINILTFWNDGNILCHDLSAGYMTANIIKTQFASIILVNFTLNKLYLNKLDCQNKKGKEKKQICWSSENFFLCLTTQEDKRRSVSLITLADPVLSTWICSCQDLTSGHLAAILYPGGNMAQKRIGGIRERTEEERDVKHLGPSNDINELSKQPLDLC